MKVTMFPYAIILTIWPIGPRLGPRSVRGKLGLEYSFLGVSYSYYPTIFMVM